MLMNWLFRLLTERNRKIFSFWDGRKAVRVDPMVIFRRLSEHQEFDPVEDFKRLRNPIPKYRVKAVGNLAGIAREVFELPVYNGTHGLTENELISLMGKFQTDMAALKKNTLAMPEQSQPSESVTTASN